MIQLFKLIEKKNLTHNVFEMIFESENEIKMKPGQFVTFLLENIGGRAYSILKLEGKKITLIIKKRELDGGGRGGSKFICELNIGDTLKGVGPAGHFLLKENSNNKLFIGTGTGFVPLFNMINYSLNKYKETEVKFIFGIREENDVFYISELEKIKKANSNFDFEIYISRVKDLYRFQNQHTDVKIHSGYTTNNLIKENIIKFKEAYICGAPTMIEGSVEKLINLGFIENENIFYEKY
ncbi:MAG: FAD-dependent oxidoreductase [Candidatus Gracilibacteria bacterium]